MITSATAPITSATVSAASIVRWTDVCDLPAVKEEVREMCHAAIKGSGEVAQKAAMASTYYSVRGADKITDAAIDSGSVRILAQVGISKIGPLLEKLL